VHRLSGVFEIPWQDSRFEKFESCTPVHLAFDRFQPVDVSFNGTIAPGRRDRQFHRFQIAAERVGELGQKMESRRTRRLDPGAQLLGASPSHHGSKLKNETAQSMRLGTKA
jgi:hypothetical protein